MTTANVVRPHESMRLRGRSLMAFALAPALPIHQWIAQLDEWTRNSPSFFAGRPIILDLAGVALAFSEIAQLITTLAARGIRVMGIEGADPDQLSPSLPPLLQGGRSNPGRDIIATTSDSITGCIAGSSEQRDPKSLLIDTPIRSGQSVAFPSGDVTVLGSVSSGAEIVAGGYFATYCFDRIRPCSRTRQT